MERLVAAHPRARGDREAILAQAGRELLLLQSSDWPFLVSTGQAGEYAVERFLSHLERFGQLADLAGLPDLPSDARRLADETYELDKVFPDLDYRVFAEREPHRD